MSHTATSDTALAPLVEAHWGSSGARVGTLQSRREAVDRVIRTLRERYREPLTLDAMARVAFSSPYHFNRVFRQITGVSPGQYLAAVRLEAAKRLLLTTHLSVTAICYEIGYNSVGSFTTLFTALVGVSPHRLRRLDRNALGGVLRSLPQAARAASGRETLRVEAPPGFDGQVFVGLFPTAIPRGRPLACAVADGPGGVQLPPVADRSCYAFALGLGRDRHPADLLLCSDTLRGSTGPLHARAGEVEPAVLTLRPPDPADPPLLVALPCLLAEHAAG
ncbi:MAG: helix-turn-helix transcriptional regulator [Gemmatimonadetes bacterium]|nr:helix-turn-helix transcriptional regulator [Gemmatimonadota bacterium]